MRHSIAASLQRARPKTYQPSPRHAICQITMASSNPRGAKCQTHKNNPIQSLSRPNHYRAASRQPEAPHIHSSPFPPLPLYVLSHEVLPPIHKHVFRTRTTHERARGRKGRDRRRRMFLGR